MSKDGVQAFADEITLVRQEIDKLQRTSLNKHDAETLHEILIDAVDDMRKATAEAPKALQGALKADRDRMAHDAAQAATRAAERVMGDIREQLAKERLQFAQSAGEARRAAWRSFGGFWVWLIAMLATGALIGALATIFVVGARTAYDFGDRPERYCTLAGGNEGQSDNGSEYCVFWYD